MIALLAARPSIGQEADSYDLVIRGGMVYDGVSVKGRVTDIGIRGARIAALGDLAQSEARQVVSARGLAVAPGFIDIHTHSDFNPFLKAASPHKVIQGVTTEVVGNCGMSAAPLMGFQREEISRVWLREGVVIPEKLPWKSVAQYFHALEERGLATNFALLVGHGNLRSAVMGLRPGRASKRELGRMRKFLRDSLREGAFGISFGLTYLPGIFADEREIGVLAGEAARAGGLAAFHMRSEGKKLIESVEEVLRVAEKTRATVEISHLKAAGVRNWPKADALLERIDSARARGLPVFSDAYPYEASFAELGVILPEEIYQSPERRALLLDPSRRDELKRRVTEEFEKSGLSLDNVMIAKTSLGEHKDYEGKRVAAIARQKGIDALDFLLDLLAAEDFQVSAFSFSQSPAIVRRIIRKDYVSIGSDNIADFSPRPHPRVFGTFPRVIEKFVREERALALGEAIRKMTFLPASVMGIEGRGTLSPGAFADIVIFDVKKIRSRATYESPSRLARGVRYVFVNGKMAVKEGKPTGVLAGQVLRRARKGSETTRA